MDNVLFLDDKVVIGLSIGGGIVGFIIVAVVVFFLVAIISKKVKNKKSNEISEKILFYLGGKDNIVSIEAKGSRLSLSLKNKELLNEEELKKLGVTSILKMSNKLTLVMGNLSSEVVSLYNNQ